MTKLTDAQTKAAVAYLRKVAETTAEMGQTGSTIAGDLADALELGRDFKAIKSDLAMRALVEVTMGSQQIAGLAGGYIGALSMIEAVLDAKEPEQSETVWKQEFLNHYYD